jgi:DNA invertase Pin-like site-specific DNA recombinase
MRILEAEMRKLRAIIGPEDPRRKLTSAQARDIRSRVEQGQSQSGVARLYGLNRTTVRAMVNAETYMEDEAWPE